MADGKKVIVGVCAMEKKSQSKPMREILARMGEYYNDHLEVLIFPEDDIIQKDVSEWPKCDCLVSFHSKGFPLRTAIEYTNLYPNVYVINDLERQYDLMNRSDSSHFTVKSGR